MFSKCPAERKALTLAVINNFRVTHPTIDLVPLRERIKALDILRGIAILGMIISHFDGYSLSKTGVNHFIGQFVNWFIDARFLTIFAILFGAGFAIQLSKTKVNGEKVVPKFIRRMLALAFIGFLIEVGTGYEILVAYATCGLLLILIRNWSTKALLVVFFICLVLNPIYKITYETVYSVVYSEAKAKSLNPSRMKVRAVRIERSRMDSISNKTHNYLVAVEARAKKFALAYSIPDRTFVALFSNFLMLIILGFLAMRIKIFENPGKYRKLIIWLMGIGIVLSAITEWIIPFYPMTPELQYPNVSFPLEVTLFFISTGLDIPREFWLAFTYIGIVLLLLSANYNKWSKRFSLFATVGRMALTNYLLQALILSLLYSSYGFALPQLPETIPVLIFAPCLFIMLVLFSRWWLRRFQFGPLEWLWRCITYWKIQPMRIITSE